MLNILTTASHHILPNRPATAPARIVLCGPSGSGKTALLYRFKTGEFVTTIPTCVANIERFQTSDPPAEWHVWDIAGGRNLTVTCYRTKLCTSETIILFTIDPSDSNGVNANIEDDLVAAVQCEFKALIVLFTQRDREGVSEEDLWTLRKRVFKVIDGGAADVGTRKKCVVWDDLEELSAKTGAQMEGLLRRLVQVSRTGSVPKLEVPPKLTDEELLRRIEEAEKNPVHELEPDEFLRRMETGELESWDHMSRMRAGFLCLGECITRGMPVLRAADMFTDKLDNMLKAKPDKFPITKNRTLTIFWLCRIFSAMVSYRSAHGVLPSADHFREFLLEYRDLMDDRAWAQYYTKDLLFSQEAKDAWRLPDLQPLPTQTHPSPKKPIPVERKKPQPKRNADILKRYAYAILKTAKSTNQRRAAVINDTFPIIQRHIMRLRAQSVEDVEPYSETQAYFWTQMVHAAAQSVPEGSVLDITELSYESFSVLFPELLGADDAWKEYYTPEQWNSIEARMSTVLPTLKPLPNVLSMPGEKQVEESISSMLDERLSPDPKGSSYQGCPGIEELLLKVQWAVKSTAEPTDESAIPDTHAKLIRRIFVRLVSEAPEKNSSDVGEAWAAISHLVSEKQVTKAAFWWQMVINAFCGMDDRFHGEVERFRGMVEDAGHQERTRNGLFEKFLTVNPELAWEDLWQVYYSDETWNSEDVKEMYVMPDRRALPAYIKQNRELKQLSKGEDLGEWEIV